MSVDPFKQLFEQADPTRGLSAHDIDALVEDGELFQRVLDRTKDVPHRRASRRPWRRVTLITVATVLVLGGAAAAITFLRSPVTNTTQMSCYSQDTLHSKVISEMPYGTHPLETCKAQLHWKSAPSSRTPAGLLCVLPNGTLGGFPPSKRYQSCSSIGLGTFNGKLAHPHVLTFERAAHSYFESHACPTVGSARHELLELIGKYGLRGWRVDVDGSISPSACATLAILPTTRSIDVIGVVEKSD